MPRKAFAVTSLLLLFAPLLTGGAKSVAAAAPAPRPFSFAAPRKMGNPDGGHPGSFAAAPDGTLEGAYISADNTTLFAVANRVFAGDFSSEPLDSSAGYVGSERMIRDSRGRLHLIWYHNLTDGSGDTIIDYARKDRGGRWQVVSIPGTRTGKATSGGYKVTGLARDGSDRIYVLWARNLGGARLTWSDDGATWAPPETLPGPFSHTAADFTLAASSGGYLFVGWFDRESTDIQVQMRARGGAWEAPRDVSSRPGKGQDYSPQFAAAPDGGMRLVWSGYSGAAGSETDGFYREWTPAAGWVPDIVPLFHTPGRGHSGLGLAVDSAGVNHVVWDDDSGRTRDNVTTYYIHGTRGGFSTPQPVFTTSGDAPARYPAVAVGAGPGRITLVHIVANSDAGAPESHAYDNYYTWTDAGVSASQPPPLPPPLFIAPRYGTPGLPWYIHRI